MKIKLSDSELNYIYNLAKKRHDAKHESFRNSSQIIPEAKKDAFKSIYDIDQEYMPHFLGLVGEYAWSKYSGEPLDEEIYSVRDNGEDFKGIEVKTITYIGKGEPELKITVKEYQSRKAPEQYVLCRFDMQNSQIEILGDITRENFDKEKKEKKYGRFLPKNFVVPLSKMRKLK